jgi:hypothetical protein
VAAAFLGLPCRRLVVNHINGDKLDCRAENVEWVSPRPLRPVRLFGEANPNAKLTADRVREMRALAEQGVSFGELGRRFGVTSRAAYRVVKRVDWKHVL